jgi:hypothetical protein
MIKQRGKETYWIAERLFTNPTDWPRTLSWLTRAQPQMAAIWAPDQQMGLSEVVIPGFPLSVWTNYEDCQSRVIGSEGKRFSPRSGVFSLFPTGKLEGFPLTEEVLIWPFLREGIIYYAIVCWLSLKNFSINACIY